MIDANVANPARYRKANWITGTGYFACKDYHIHRVLKGLKAATGATAKEWFEEPFSVQVWYLGHWVWSWKERQYSCRVYGVFSDHFSFWMLMSLVPPIVDEGAAWEAINAAPSPYLKFFTCDQPKFAVWFCEVRGHYVKVKMCFRIYMSFVDF